MSIFRVYLPKFPSDIGKDVSSLNLAALQKRCLFSGEIASKKNIVLGRQIMATYSFLYINTEEHIGRSTQIECATDERAMEVAAEEAGDYRAIQIWDGERPIAMIGNPRYRGQ